MQIVLAIHADRRQTEHIAALLKKRAAVEVVEASDAGEGLQEIGDRIPDLILTSPLLSPFDEGVLAEYLRELGSAAAHVQTLRIPVMTMPDASSGGFFSLRKKKRVEATLDGCDPAYFVEEITQYLARAAEDRKTTASSSWAAPAAEPSASNDASEPYPMASPDSSSYRPVSHSYSTSPVIDEYGRRESESGFPPYQASYEQRIDADAPPSAATYGADRGRALEDETPVYQPPVEAAAPIYQPPAEAATPIYQPPVDTAPPIYQPADAAWDRTPADTSIPVYQPADPALDRPSVEATTPIAQGPVETRIDQPLDSARFAPLDTPRTERHGDAAASHRASPATPAAPVVGRPSFLDRLRSEPAASRYTKPAASTPIYQPPRAADAPIYRQPLDPVVHVFEPPAPQMHTPAPDAPDLTFEPESHAHASLVLEPSQPRPLAADPPFVVHSTEERTPLSESLERAAAELEASSLGEPMPARETERVPMHQLSSIEEIPLPEELAARVERTAAWHRAAAPEPSASAPPTAPTSATADPRERARLETTSGSRSLLASPIDLDPPARPEPFSQPAPATASIADSASAADTSGKATEKPATHKRTPSFEAALAAIRKAWGRPRRGANSNLASPLSLNLNGTNEETPAPVAPAQVDPAPLGPPEPVLAAAPTIEPALTIESDSSAREVDLTLDIEALDESASVILIETTAPEQVEIATQPIDEDVYELSASPELHDLDADLAAAGPPPPVRELFPATLFQRAEEPPAVEPVEQAAAPRKRDKHRKKSDKRRPPKAEKAAAAPPAPPAPPRPPQPQEPAQDEWGLFDPNQCGFAALVDKLNEVTDEKEQKPPTKTTVRVISYG